MAIHRFVLNGEPVSVDCDGDMPLLWVLRDLLQLTGTKFGCGKSLCGACTVHVDGAATRTCMLPIAAIGAAGSEVTTIEGLHRGGDSVQPANRPAEPLAGPPVGPPAGRHPVQQAWIDEAVSQCGYCQSGQIMAAAALLANNPKPTDRDIQTALRGNLCRCGTYQRILRAVRRASGQ
ncbi:MAG: (2Fe-2S)-binding protein [Planctomycetota bacterium]